MLYVYIINIFIYSGTHSVLGSFGYFRYKNQEPFGYLRVLVRFQFQEFWFRSGSVLRFWLFCSCLTAAIQIESNAVFHERTKHIQNDFYLVREILRCRLLKLLHVTTWNMIGELFTKALLSQTFKLLMSRYAF